MSIPVQLLARAHGHRQAIALRGQRADIAGVVRAVWIVCAIEVEHVVAGAGRLQPEITSGPVSLPAAGGVGEENLQCLIARYAVHLEAERRALQLPNGNPVALGLHGTAIGGGDLDDAAPAVYMQRHRNPVPGIIREVTQAREVHSYGGRNGRIGTAGEQAVFDCATPQARGPGLRNSGIRLRRKGGGKDPDGQGQDESRYSQHGGSVIFSGIECCSVPRVIGYIAAQHLTPAGGPDEIRWARRQRPARAETERKALMERILTVAQTASAAAVQREIDFVAKTGGRVVLPEIDLELDRGLILRSGVQLVGQGRRTVLRKGPTRIYPLAGYHNYGMLDVPLKSAAGLDVGMTVSVHDERTHGSFYETLATVTWVEGNWVGLDHGIEADYRGDGRPALTTAHPLILGHHIRDAALRNLTLEGSRAHSDSAMGGCRGGAVYFANSRDVEVTEVHESDYHGEGLSFQMCRDLVIRDSSFASNSGNGLHPGAGSTNVLFERCTGRDNERAGFFFCVRANHITVRDCRFERNAVGVSIGTRDCHNLIEGCTVEGNRGPGVLVREVPPSTEVHSCLIRNCTLASNSKESGTGQLDVVSPAYDLVLEGNEFEGDNRTAGVSLAPAAHRIFVTRNRFADCTSEVAAASVSLAAARPEIDCGFGDWPQATFRHLRTA